MILRGIFVKKFKFLVVPFLIVFLSVSGCVANNNIILNGSVEATQTKIYSEKAGKVLKILKNEGEQVIANDLIIELDSQNQSLVIKQFQGLVDAKKARLDEVKTGTRQEQISQAESAVDVAKARYNEVVSGSRSELISKAQSAVDSANLNIAIFKSNYDLANTKYESTKQLYDSGIATKDMLDDVTNKKATASLQLDNANNALKQAQSELALLKNGATKETIDAAKANVEQAEAQLLLLKNGNTIQAIQAAQADYKQAVAQFEQAQNSYEKYDIRTPITGVFTEKNIEIGEVVNTGTNIGTVTELSDLWVNFYISQKYLGAIKNGQEINLKATSLSGGIKGKIISISQIAEYTPKNIETNEAKEDTVFKFKVKILDNIESLRPGMTISASIPKGGIK
jgi:HlyD family secretion protein